MTEAEVLNKIFEDLEFLKKEMCEMKERTIDPDTILSEEEYKALEQAEQEYEKGETISLEQLRKELNQPSNREV